MDHMVNNIWLLWKVACMLSTYRTCNLTVGFLKYEFNNKLLDGVILLRVTLGVTWTQLYVYIDVPLIMSKRSGESDLVLIHFTYLDLSKPRFHIEFREYDSITWPIYIHIYIYIYIAKTQRKFN